MFVYSWQLFHIEYECYCYCCAAPGSSVLDPHFMITNPKTGEKFCFDYGGKERDVLNLVHDEKAG